MSWIDGLRFTFSSLIRQERSAAERADELEFHIAMEAERLRREGIATPQSRIAATARLGPPPAPTPSRRLLPDSVWQDMRYAVRSLRRSPAYTITTLVTLSIGLALAITALVIGDAFVTRPLPFSDSQQLMVLRQTSVARPQGFGVSLPNFADWQRLNHSFTSMAAWTEATAVASSPGAEARNIDVVRATTDYFHVFGVRPALGRVLGPADTMSSAPPAMVISTRLWREMFGSDPHIVGRTIRIDSRQVTIIGVMDAAFRYPAAADGWTAYPAELIPLMPRNTVIFSVVGRRRPGVSAGQAAGDIDAISRQLHAQYPDLGLNQATGAEVVLLRDALFRADQPIVLLLGAAILFALLIASLNLACANMARTSARRGDFVIREALGASRVRQLQYWAIEAGLLTTVSAAIGGAVAPALIHALAARPALDALQAAQPSLSPRTALLSALLALIIAALTGWWPAWRTARQAGAGCLHVTGSRRQLQGMASLIALETAMTVVLAAGGALAARAVVTVLSRPRGFTSASVLTVDLRLPVLNARTAIPLLDQVLDSARALPGVVSAGMVNTLPLTADPGFKVRNATSIRVVDGAGYVDSSGGAGYHAINGQYFAAMLIPLLEGRSINASDDSTTPPVAVISRSMANRYWPHASPIGKQFTPIGADPGLYDKQLTIVGVVGDIRASSLEEPELPDYYVSDRQGTRGVWKWYLVIRTSNDPAASIGAVRRVVRHVDSRIALSFATMTERVMASMTRRLVAGGALGGVAIASLVLVLIGIYGVVSFAVTSRNRDISVRLALGASARRIRTDIMLTVLYPVCAGTAAGLAGALLLGRLLQQLVIELNPRDPLTLLSVIVLVGAAATMAAFIPARRASAADPMAVLRQP